MKKVCLLIIVVFLVQNICSAASINTAAYRTMQMQAYQNKYRQQQNRRKPTPYWQVQSNYMTRNRIYSNYADYSSKGYRTY